MKRTLARSPGRLVNRNVPIFAGRPLSAVGERCARLPGRVDIVSTRMTSLALGASNDVRLEGRVVAQSRVTPGVTVEATHRA